MKNILLAVNSFKECAGAVKVSDIFKKYLDKSFHVIQKPITDGGDDFLEVCRFHFNLEILNYTISTPFDETDMECRAGYDRKNRTIYIESAEVLGLKRIPADKRHPLQLSSKGLGDLLHLLIEDVYNMKYEVDKVIMGIGGTGTMDMGMGMCSRFSLKMFDNYGAELDVLPENFHQAAEIEFDNQVIPFEIEVVLDVTNPLLGNNGGIIYGRQKGATPGELKVIELGWNKIVNSLYKNKLIQSPDNLYGAGGGILTGINLLKGTTIKSARQFITEELDVNNKISGIDMVITGEGAFDEQSYMGKGAGVIISMFEEENIPVVLCCGIIDSAISERFSMNIFPMELRTYVDNPIEDFEEAIRIACGEISGMTDILTKIS